MIRSIATAISAIGQPVDARPVPDRAWPISRLSWFNLPLSRNAGPDAAKHQTREDEQNHIEYDDESAHRRMVTARDLQTHDDVQQADSRPNTADYL
jgi:hypothetical protein